MGTRAADDAPASPLASDHRDTGLGRPARLLLLATGVLVVCLALMLHDLMNANRPHELHNAPWVAGLALINLVVPCARVLAGLRRHGAAERAHGPDADGGVAVRLLWLGLALVAAVDGLVFLAAAGSVPAVLAG